MGWSKSLHQSNGFKSNQSNLYCNKKAELSQRWPRDAPYVWAPWKFSGVPDNAHGYFSRIFIGLLFRFRLVLNVHGKFDFRSFPRSWDNIGGTRKNWAVPGYAHAPLFRNFSWAFIRMDPLNVLAKFEICSFPCSWDNRGYPKKLGIPSIRPRSLFSKIFNGLLFGWTLWMYRPNLKSVTFPVPEIIGGTPKKLGSPWIRPRSLFSKNF